jgi:hypothetical protein
LINLLPTLLPVVLDFFPLAYGRTRRLIHLFGSNSPPPFRNQPPATPDSDPWRPCQRPSSPPPWFLRPRVAVEYHRTPLAAFLPPSPTHLLVFPAATTPPLSPASMMPHLPSPTRLPPPLHTRQRPASPQTGHRLLHTRLLPPPHPLSPMIPLARRGRHPKSPPKLTQFRRWARTWRPRAPQPQSRHTRDRRPRLISSQGSGQVHCVTFSISFRWSNPSTQKISS